MAIILIFGDSITFGSADTEGGWAQKLKTGFDKTNEIDRVTKKISGEWCAVYNLGIPGQTSQDLLERFEFESEQRIGEDKPITFIFAIGINDSRFSQRKKTNEVVALEFEKNLQKLIKSAKKFSQRIVFVGLTPVDESKTNPIPWNTDCFYKNESIKKYDSIIQNICNKNNIFFVELFERFKIGYERLLEDGLHPNSDGHKFMFEVIKKFLEEKKLI
ncbi:MAG: GDSL-type esterase/lipase family protein [archaeon]|nr:GDSL-type esterase/lipase family protein [archaeon]